MSPPAVQLSALLESGRGWGVKQIVADLRIARERWRSARHRDLEFPVRELPSRAALEEISESLCGVLFPMRLGPPDLRKESEDDYVGHTLDRTLNTLHEQVVLELGYERRLNGTGTAGIEVEGTLLVRSFAQKLPALRSLIDSDVEAAYLGDPAARSVDEVLLCYPGILGVMHYRIAHELHELGVPIIARILSEIAHSSTGIDIHPGARIGSSFFIDHGSGVVIGETTQIGDRVRLDQAVTLGAKRFTRTEGGVLEKGTPRHPILEDDVVVHAGATILGRITIGRGSSIGGNVWLTRSVAPGSRVSQASLRHESKDETRSSTAD